MGAFRGQAAILYPFQYNPRTEDMRISGTTASLAGLERALASLDELAPGCSARVYHALTIHKVTQVDTHRWLLAKLARPLILGAVGLSFVGQSIAFFTQLRKRVEIVAGKPRSPMQ